MVNPATIRQVLGIIGNVISFGLFLSPVPTFWRIYKKKSVEEFKSAPYIATILNCAMWILYGLPFIHPNNYLVATINGIGLVIELIYIAIFLTYCSSEKRKRNLLWLAGELVFFVVVTVITMEAFHTTSNRTIWVGALCVVFNVMMYASPLTVWRQVVKTKSVKYMPLWLSVTCFLNGACWTAYACIQKLDIWMVVPNGLGTFFGAIQLVLYAWYYKSTVWDDTKPPAQVELPPSAGNV